MAPGSSPHDPARTALLGDEELELRRRAKALLRKRARALRGTVPAAAIAARSARIVAALLELDDVARATSVALFWPIDGRNEVDLRDLDARLRARGVVIAYPSIAMLDEPPDPDARVAPAPPVMTFRRVDELGVLEERGLGFRDPGDGAPELHAIDVVVVPGLQFDARGYRLGYGAGYYDRTLPRFCPPGRAIGVAFDFQLVPDLPVMPHDVPVSLVVTDERVFSPEIEGSTPSRPGA